MEHSRQSGAENVYHSIAYILKMNLWKAKSMDKPSKQLARTRQMFSVFSSSFVILERPLVCYVKHFTDRFDSWLHLSPNEEYKTKHK